MKPLISPPSAGFLLHTVPRSFIQALVSWLYWIPALLSLDEFRAQFFVKELNALGASGGSRQGEQR